MSEHFENINPWVEKLELVKIPEVTISWETMHVLLDKEMPVSQNKDWRRWLLLIILLLLLIGVCNCPGILKTNKATDQHNLPTASQADHSENGTNDQIDANDNKKRARHEIADHKKSTFLENSDSAMISNESQVAISKKHFHSKKISQPGSETISATKSSSFLSTKKINSTTGKQGKKEYSVPEVAEQNLSVTTKDSSQSNTTTATLLPDSAKSLNSADSLQKTKKEIATDKKDSTNKKAVKADSVEEAKGWLVALGINQFFPVGDQEKSNFNSSGTTGGIADYIPVPVARYYFHKWLYLQAEFQFNSPQYTRTLLASQTIVSGISGQDTAKSIFIKKLFYFNIPISVHFSPAKNFYIGAGLQYSMLTNGVALFQDAKPDGQAPAVILPGDSSFITSKVQSFKNDPVYHKLNTHELRFLFDINYHWKPLTLGLRYNQAFTNFINLQVSTATITQAHNASLQLYFRYTIWDHRKKYFLPK